jgi:gluconate 2-dehydrogenase gamma chain
MSETYQLQRREMLRQIMLLAGASATASVSFSALATAAKGTENYFNAPVLDILSAVADTIVPATDTPGALDAEVPARLDALMLHWAAPETRNMLAGALDRIDLAAKAATGAHFEALSPDARKTFLIKHEKAAMEPAPPPADAQQDGNPFKAKTYVADNGYQRLKELIVRLYYVSEIGMTLELVYEHVPGAWVPSLEITPGMRPYVSRGLM